MLKYRDIATLMLRLALAADFLSAVASRLGFWGKHSSGWTSFLSYTAEINPLLPKSCIPFVGVTATILEAGLGLLLFLGFKTRLAATGSAILLLMFALAMAFSLGIKEPLDYSVFADSFAALLLATMPDYRWSLDALQSRQKVVS
jgi:putative oxidoreductase